LDTKRVSVATHGACSFCKRGKVNSDCSGLDYPYTEVTEVLGALVSVKICDQCLLDFKQLAVDGEVKK